ncbi:MAG: hypothetical protein CR993_00850 [Rhodobacterales bacterium]|nr:MAG: hypothetical protein CR993_00850 [Rhodobacterales bacterium]
MSGCFTNDAFMRAGSRGLACWLRGGVFAAVSGINRFRAVVLGLGMVFLAALPVSAQDFGPLVGASFGKGREAVVVFLHGDMSNGRAPTYHQALMRSLSDAAPQVTAIAMYRPGYGDGFVKLSPGDNNGRWDQYTADNNDLLAETLQSLREGYPESRLVVAGHSGGAAQLGAVMGRYPGLVDVAILISCPCDFPVWRAGRNRQLVRSADQNPIDLISGIDPATRILAVTGKRDRNTFPKLAKAYVAAARAAGLDATLELVPEADHWNDKLKARVLEIMLEEVSQ